MEIFATALHNTNKLNTYITGNVYVLDIDLATDILNIAIENYIQFFFLNFKWTIVS